VNQYESQAMREILVKSGFKDCISRDIADIYVVNTCTVTERADRESRYWIGFFHKMNPNAKIVVTGCYMETNADDVSFLPGVFRVLKNSEKNQIAEILDPEAKDPEAAFRSLRISDFKSHTKAFIKIQDGCENTCSYCKVPLVRGYFKSRPISDILDEAKDLIARGFKELVLTGICLGAWGKDMFPGAISKGAGIAGLGLVDVLRAVTELAGDFRVRLSSIEPKYVTDELIGFLARNKKMCKHLHIPLQSGDDEILGKMNRPYTSEAYQALVNKIRANMEDIALTTDVLIGFPGESDANFRNTIEFIKGMLPLRTHIFTFSRRKGTPAYGMAGEVKDTVLKKRFYDLNTAALGASYVYRRKFLNEKLNVLVETKRDKQSGLLMGYSDNYIKILFQGPDELMKNIVPVRVEYMTLMLTVGAYAPNPS